jgi:hypothetical protein
VIDSTISNTPAGQSPSMARDIDGARGSFPHLG